eukprot:scaffold3337_cov95-Cylindrotheca_fusiformis.AAC.4
MIVQVFLAIQRVEEKIMAMLRNLFPLALAQAFQTMEVSFRAKLVHFYPIAFWLLTSLLCCLSPFIVWEYSLAWTSDTDFSKTVIQRDTKPSPLPLHTVVVYTGPTQLNRTEGKNELYLRNFEYFLSHNGVDCESHHTIVTLSDATYNYYMQEDSVLQRLATTCGNALRVIRRENTCYDMGSMYVVLNTFDLSQYDYFVYLNCGVTGPLFWNSATISWTRFFTSLLNDQIKMAGLSINCQFMGRHNTTHVQSMAFALDKIGLGIIQSSGAVYNCHQNGTAMTKEDRLGLIDRYEIGMSRAILQSNYSIAAWFSSSVFFSYPGYFFYPEPVIYSSTLGDCLDIWNIEDFLRHSLGCPLNSPSCNLTFFKTSRFIPPDISKEVGFQMENAEMEELMTMYDKKIADKVLALALQSLHSSAFFE